MRFAILARLLAVWLHIITLKGPHTVVMRCGDKTKFQQYAVYIVEEKCLRKQKKESVKNKKFSIRRLRFASCDFNLNIILLAVTISKISKIICLV